MSFKDGNKNNEEKHKNITQSFFNNPINKLKEECFKKSLLIQSNLKKLEKINEKTHIAVKNDNSNYQKDTEFKVNREFIELRLLDLKNIYDSFKDASVNQRMSCFLKSITYFTRDGLDYLGKSLDDLINLTKNLENKNITGKQLNEIKTEYDEYMLAMNDMCSQNKLG